MIRDLFIYLFNIFQQDNNFSKAVFQIGPDKSYIKLFKHKYLQVKINYNKIYYKQYKIIYK